MAKCTAVNDNWMDCTIVDGVARAMMKYNVREEGESVTVRDTLCYLIEVQP